MSQNKCVLNHKRSLSEDCTDDLLCLPCQLSKLRRTEYTKLCKVGQGTYGKVFSGRMVISTTPSKTKFIAMKQFAKMDAEGIPHDALRELSALNKLKDCKHIVEILKVELLEDVIVLVMTGMQHNLSHFIKQFSFNDSIIAYIMKPLSNALYFCSKNGVIHRDLKPQNILINNNKFVKICDFGQARLYIEGRTYTREAGTIWFRPFDVLMGNDKYSYEYDMWSLGCIYAELIHKSPIFPGDSEWDMIRRIVPRLQKSIEKYTEMVNLPFYDKNSPIPSFKNSQDIELDDICLQMLDVNPATRISAYELNSFFENKTIEENKMVNNETVLLNLDKHTDINEKMRAILVDWMLELSKSFKLKLDTVQLAIYILDTYLYMSKNVLRKSIQLIGCVALGLASKLNEEYAACVSDYVYSCDGAYTAKEFLDMELEVTRKLNYDLWKWTPMNLLQPYTLSSYLSYICCLHPCKLDYTEIANACKWIEDKTYNKVTGNFVQLSDRVEVEMQYFKYLHYKLKGVDILYSSHEIVQPIF